MFLSCIFCLKSDPELQFGDGGPPDIRTFTFEPRDPPKRIEIVVVDDDIVEATEDHVIRLVVPEGETGVNLPRDSNTISVQDDGDSESGRWEEGEISKAGGCLKEMISMTIDVRCSNMPLLRICNISPVLKLQRSP